MALVRAGWSASGATSAHTGLLFQVESEREGENGEVVSGKLFKQPDTLPLDRSQIELLVEAAKAKWEHVEPAIFGTLLERALLWGWVVTLHVWPL